MHVPAGEQRGCKEKKRKKKKEKGKKEALWKMHPRFYRDRYCRGRYHRLSSFIYYRVEVAAESHIGINTGRD